MRQVKLGINRSKKIQEEKRKSIFFFGIKNRVRMIHGYKKYVFNSNFPKQRNT